MSTPKVYIKQGKTGYKEQKMIDGLTKAIAKKIEEDPNFEFEPARDKEDLKKLYDKFVPEDVKFEDIPADDSTGNVQADHKDFKDGLAETIQPADQPTGFIDPLNRQEPKVRDYVLKNEFGGQGAEQSTQTVFNEPTSFTEAFSIPGANQDDQIKQSGTQNENQQGQSSSTGNGSSQSSPKQPKSDPVNPNYNDMSNSAKKKSTKKFAKAIVYGVCKLSEMGCVWYVTKDINEAKLAQYEATGEISSADFGILLTLSEQQQITVRDWFAMQVQMAPTVLKVPEEEQEELANSLAVVMEEKGIAPTPMQELIINTVSTIVIGLGAKAYMLSAQINGVLNQIRVSKQEQQNAAFQQPPIQTPEPVAQPVKQETKSAPDPQQQEMATTPVAPVMSVLQDELPIVEKAIETKE